MIEKKPFVNYDTDDAKIKRDQFTVELNPIQRKQLNEIKKWLDIKSDIRTVKLVVDFWHHAMVGQFGSDNIKYLFKKERERLSDFESFE